MSELRKNIITDDWVIIAKERAKRPVDFSYDKNLHEHKEYHKDCPFCPGNEHLSTENILQVNDHDNKWRIRVIPNKYPALDNNSKVTKSSDKFFYKINGFGFHEVVIENPLHNIEPSFYNSSDLQTIIEVFKNRYLDLGQNKDIQSIVIFKNHGLNAGTSLEHPHSQIVALPFSPKLIKQRIKISADFHKQSGECIFCHNLKNEIDDKERIIIDSQYFAAFIPFAALSPFHIWIFPKKHNSSFGNISEEEIQDLSRTLKSILFKLYKGLNNPDFNLIIRSVADNQQDSRFFHWYISIIPRINKTAGFELSTGTFINPSLPEDSACFLRSVKNE